MVLGPNVTTMTFDKSHFPALEDDVEFEYKVVSSFAAGGPFERVGSVVVVAVSGGTPAAVRHVRLLSRYMGSRYLGTL